jgi:hypothetical protein
MQCLLPFKKFSYLRSGSGLLKDSFSIRTL